MLAAAPLKVADQARLQRVLDGLVVSGAPGVLARFQDGDHLWAGSSGVATLGEATRVAPGGSFRIASVTKALTATVVLQLAGEGVIRLDDTVQDRLPGLVPGGSEITVRHLLAHTSGLYNYTDDLSDAGVVLRDRLARRSPHELVAQATSCAPLFPPGTSRSYCNTGYILLGMLIEQAAGSSYGHQIERRILRPAGMHHTLVPGDDASIPEPHAHGYLPGDDGLADITEFNASLAWAAGGIISAAEDLNLFFAALLSGRLLKPAGMHAIQNTVPTLSPGIESGLGIGRIRLPGGLTVWGKSGSFSATTPGRSTPSARPASSPSPRPRPVAGGRPPSTSSRMSSARSPSPAARRINTRPALVRESWRIRT